MPACPTPMLRRRAHLLTGCAVAVALSSPAFAQAQGFKANPSVATGSVVVSQGQTIPGGTRDTVQVFSPQAVIDWTPSDATIGGGAIAILPQGNELVFTADPANVGGFYTVLNRVIPNDPSRPIQFDGLVKSQFDSGYGATTGGNIWFYSPGGIIAGATSRFDVGSLVLSANDIDTTNGLFGDGTTSQAGTIRFRGLADSRSFVTIQSGAQINAEGSYLALVAPRVTQGGTLSVNGSAALVAAEQADITIPVSGGLFDISVSVGSAVNTPGETTLTHSGTTAVSDPQATGEARRVYLMAVPKNDAVTMLVSGSLGYDAASQAQVTNGAIVLTTGPGVSFDTPFSTSSGTINIMGGEFRGDVTAVAQDITLDTSTAALNFTGDLTVTSDSGAIAMVALNARDIDIGGFALLQHSNAKVDGSSSISVTANSGSRISAGGLSLDSFAEGLGESGYGDPAQSAKGGSLLLSAAGGIITSEGGISLSSSAQGGFGSTGSGASGTGGTVIAQATGGGQIIASTIFLTADGEGGFGSSSGGAGTGGTTTILATGSSRIEVGDARVQAVGFGGYGVDDNGGLGKGGAATISVQGSSFGANGFETRVQIDASAVGGDSSAIGGAAQGGTAQLLIGDAGSSALFGNGLSIHADADGGWGGTDGGTALGGTVNLWAGSGTLALSLGEGLATDLGAAARGGYGDNRSGDATGGGIKVDLKGTSASFQSLGIDASAATIDVGYNDSSFPPRAANGGDTNGGTADLTFIGASVSADYIDMDLRATGGRGSDATGGRAQGGTGSIRVTGGSLDLIGLWADASGYGGGAQFGFGHVDQGGAGMGGSVALTLTGVEATDLTSLSLSASGYGADGKVAGGGVGGNVALTSASAANLGVTEIFELYAEGIGGSGPDAGGGGTGGQIAITSDGGSIAANYLTVGARGLGGDGVDSSRFYFFSAAPGLTITGFGGSAIGGNVTLLSKGGATITSAVAIDVVGSGGAGFDGLGAGDGTGGTATIKAAGGTIDFGETIITVDAAGEGGASEGSSARPTGRGGTILVQLDPGASGDPASQLLFDTLVLDAHGSIYDPSDVFAAPGNGGRGVGGRVTVAVNGGTLQGNALELIADGTGAHGAAAAKAGSGFQGRAEFAMSGGSVSLAEGLQIRARAFGGTGAAEGSDEAAGTGGDAGVGPNPFGSDAGAYGSLTGGQLAAGFVELTGDSQGGYGGNATAFGMFGTAGDGGDAGGGTAVFSSVGSASLDIGGLSVSAQGLGGAGGAVEYGYGANSISTKAGAGGTGTGGIATAQVGGGGLTPTYVDANARGVGGDGGYYFAIDGFFSSLPPGAGGAGGAGIGGSATIGAASTSSPGATLIAIADGQGGFGGYGPVGGVGGGGTGGTALLDISGNHAFGQLGAYADGIGGGGGAGDTGDGGNGATASGGNARLHVSGATTDITANSISLSGAAFGGSGGSGGFAFDSTAPLPKGGNGGNAVGGQAVMLVSGGRFSVTGIESLASLSADGFGGDGGQGGLGGIDGTDPGQGGAGANGRGGTVLVHATGGDSFIDLTYLSANGYGASGGLEGGYGTATGPGGSGRGGGITVFAEDVPDDGVSVALDLGSATFAADGISFSGSGQDLAGSIRIEATTPGSAPILSFSSLDAHARGTVFDPEVGGGIATLASGAAITVFDAASYDALGPVRFTFDGGGGLSAGGSVAISSFDAISVQHANATGPSISASSITAHADGAIRAEAGSLLKADGRIELRSLGASVDLAGAETGDDVDVRAALDATVGGIRANNATIFAGQADADAPVFSGRNATITGTWQLDGNASVGATGDVLVGAGAQVVADRAITLEAGDDITIRAGALVRAANNPPPETGYGLSDPLQQASQLRLLAGINYLDGPVDGELGSILIDGNLEAPNRTLFMSAGAVSAGPATQLAAGNLYVRLFNIPAGDQLPSTDGGQLTGACLEGSVCLGATNVSGIVRIGESGFEPINLRLAGGIDGTDVLLRARSVELGRVGVNTAIRASDRLVIESTAENLVLNGPITVTGGLQAARVATMGDIVGAQATLAAPGTLDLFAADNITLDGIDAPTIRTVALDGSVLNGSGITLPGTATMGRLATTGALLVNAAHGVTLGTLATNGAATLTAASGAVVVSTDADTAGLTATGRTVSLAGVDGLTVTSATATGGDLLFTTAAGDLVVNQAAATGGVIASGGSVRIGATGDLKVISATATTGDLLLSSARALNVGSAESAGAMTLTAGGSVGIVADSIAAGGAVTLGASAGSILVGTDIAAAGRIRATAQSLDLRALGNLAIDQATATSGDVTLASAGGNVTLGQVTAANALAVSAAGTIAVDGVVTGTTIAFTSKDLAIGAQGQLGSKSQTTALTLTSTADRMFLGDATGAGYRIDNTELARIATGGDLSIVSAPSSFQGDAYSLLDPAGTNIVIGSMSFDGAQLGSTGTFRIASPRSIGILGHAQYRNFGSGQTVTYSALSDISLAAETGLVTVRDASGGLSGTLRLEAQQVHAMSTSARTEIAGLQLNEVRQRLGTNDQIANDGGYFQAGSIIVRIGRLLFVQNSGGNGDNPDDRRGFTANNLTIESTGTGPAQVVVNGRIGMATGAALVGSTKLTGSFDPASGFNGCLAGISCAAAPPPPPFVPDFAPVLSASRDQVRSEEDQDEAEEALQASQTQPDPVIQFVEAPASRFDPLIDEPVTGAGNEDFWLTPTAVTPTP